MTAAITDPSNPQKIDWAIATPGVLRRAVAKAKARIDHNAGPAIAQWAMYWARHKKTTMPTDYDEVRPIPYARNWLSTKLWGNRHVVITDCSGSGDIVSALAGVDINPAGFAWGSGEGNSTSFFNNAIERFSDVAKLKPGDYVAYGPNGDAHLVTVVAVKPEVMVVSHGQPGGPFIQPLSLDTRPRTFLRFNTRAKIVHFPPK
jgi:hypothetical protein